MTGGKAIKESALDGLKLMNRGKVRDIYDLGEYLLIVATDRISAFDVVMNDPIPDKGKVLTQISAFWFNRMADIVPHHLISTEPEKFPESCRPHREILRDRSPAGGMRGARLSVRLRMGGLQKDRRCVRNFPARRTARVLPHPGADFYPCNQGRARYT